MDKDIADLLQHIIDGQKLIMKAQKFLLHRNNIGQQLIKDMNEWLEKSANAIPGA